MKEFIFTWNVQNISYSWHKTGQEIISQKFETRPFKRSTWTLRLYPRGIENSDYFSLYLCRENDKCSEDIEVNFELSCITVDKSEAQSCFFPETFKIFKKADKFGVVHFLHRHEVFGGRKAKYLPHDTLTLRCRMWKDGDGEEFWQLSARTILFITEINAVVKIKPEIGTHERVKILSTNTKELLLLMNFWFQENAIDIRIQPVNVSTMRCTSLKASLVDKKTEKRLCEHTSVWLDGPQNEAFRLPFSGTLQREENDNPKEGDFEIRTEVIYSKGESTKIENSRDMSLSPDYLSNYIDNRPRLSVDLWKLYKEQTHCDVELKAKDGSIFAHKFVLCARSSVFFAMLTDEMKEKKTGFIEIEDISARTLEKFITFLYTDIFVEHQLDEIIKLYYVADKYEVSLLKLVCSLSLMKNVNVDNVCEILAVAHLHSNLKLQIIEFILENEEKVFSSNQWEKFSEENSDLALKSMLWKYKKEKPCYITAADKMSVHPNVLYNLKSLYQNQIVSDIVIKTASASFPAHKAVLCARSLFFKDFLSDVSTQDSTEFQMEDLEDDTVSRMLLYLHTDSLKDLTWDIAKKLYRTSNTYKMHELMFECSYFFLSSVRVSNACDLLLLAHEHNDVKLKSAVVDYICIYDEEVFASNEWDELRETDSILALDTMHAKYKK